MAPPSLSSPYATAPSSPKLLSFSDSDSDSELLHSVSSFVPFNWEEKPGIPKTVFHDDDEEDYGEISFDFRVQRRENPSLVQPAEELFSGGKIKTKTKTRPQDPAPLKPPPRLQQLGGGEISGRKSVSSKRMMIVGLSGRSSCSSISSISFVDPFEAAMERARRGDYFSEDDETASFVGSCRRLKKLKDLLPFRKVSGSGSGSSSGSGSENEPEPDNGYEDGRRSLTLLRRQYPLCCFMQVF